MPSRRPQGDPTVAVDDAEKAAQSSPEEPEPSASEEGGAPVCVNDGKPATYETIDDSVNKVYYCDEHAAKAGGGVKKL